MHRLNELTEVVLRRSELAVDFAAASLDELAKRDLASCAPGALKAIRLHVYQRSTIKDVRLVNPDGSVICSAYSETLEFDKGWADRRDMLASHDGTLSAGGASSSAKRISESSHAPMVAGSWI